MALKDKNDFNDQKKLEVVPIGNKRSQKQSDGKYIISLEVIVGMFYSYSTHLSDTLRGSKVEKMREYVI